MLELEATTGSDFNEKTPLQDNVIENSLVSISIINILTPIVLGFLRVVLF